MKFGFNNSMNWGEFMAAFPKLAPVLIPIAILSVIIMATAVISLLRKKLPLNQTIIWLAIIIAGNLIGSVVYFAIGSKMLDEKEQNGRDEK